MAEDEGGQMAMDLFQGGELARLDNRWRHPGTSITMHPARGTVWRPGVSFALRVLDPQYGAEACVLLRAHADEADAAVRVDPPALRLRPVLVPTDAGAVLCMLIALVPVPDSTIYRAFLNVFDPDTLRLLDLAARQTHVKRIVFDLDRVEVVAFSDIENTFGLETARDVVASARKRPERCNYRAAVSLATAQYPVSRLLEMAQASSS